MTALPLNFNVFDFTFAMTSQQEREVIFRKSTLADLQAVVNENPNQAFELIDGYILTMSNASIGHNKIISNLARLMGNHFIEQDSGCEFYFEAPCKIDEFNILQPDFSVMCHEPTHPLYVENPLIIGEVFSKSTKSHDLNVKLEKYQAIPAVQEIFYLEQDEFLLTAYRRDKTDINRWHDEVINGEDGVVNFESVGFVTTIKDIYRAVLS